MGCLKMANEKRLIDGNKAQAVLVNMAEHLMESGNPEMAGAVGYAAEIIGKQRTVDAVEVVHGHWEEDEVEAGDPYDGNSVYRFDVMRCSVCGECFGVSMAYNYCPNCGAKMDGGLDEAR